VLQACERARANPVDEQVFEKIESVGLAEYSPGIFTGLREKKYENGPGASRRRAERFHYLPGAAPTRATKF